jgi:FixJ family two-component response regulator
MNQLFYEKYKPRNINEIIGDEIATQHIINFIKNFPNGKYCCLLISGSHGTGKTCRIETVLNHFNYNMKKINLNNFKKAEDIAVYIKELTTYSSIISMFNIKETKKSAIIIDELDTELFLQEKQKLIEMMKINNKNHICPIIFVFDTKHNKIINILKKGSIEILVNDPDDNELLILLKKICYHEQIHIKNLETANKIVKFAQKDFRRLCMILNDIVNEYGNQQITSDMLKDYTGLMIEKKISLELFRSAKSLLMKYSNMEECLQLYEVEKVNIPLMIHQNYLQQLIKNNFKFTTQQNIENIQTITKSFSIGDVIDNYIYGEQRWDITDVHGFYTCCLPSYFLNPSNLKENKYISNPKFPIDMNKTSIKKSNKKHILNASRNFNSTDPFDYVYIGKILTKLIMDNNIEELIKLMKGYKLSLDRVETILKIDKNNQYKITLTTKQKKLLKDIE